MCDILHTLKPTCCSMPQLLAPFLEPLVDELLYLYIHGIQVEDPATHQPFTLRVALRALVADYRAIPKLLLMSQVRGEGYCCCSA